MSKSLCLALLLLAACAAPDRTDTCPAAQACGGGCCPASQTCDPATQQCITCERTSCVLSHADCGRIPDGCGGELDCGGCAGGAACGADHKCPGTCVPKGCSDLGKDCGAVDDGCGGTLDCGTCTGDDTCTDNVCGHPDPCASDPASCANTCFEPTGGLDFGTVDVGDAKVLELAITNCGTVRNSLTELGELPDGFTFDAAPPLPVGLPPGAKVTLRVRFVPTTDAAVNTTVRITTTYAAFDVGLKGAGHVLPHTCDPSIRPVAHVKVKKGSVDITANPTVAPLDTVSVDATASTFPQGGTPKYEWTLVSQPGYVAIQPRANPVTANLFADTLGDYVVRLVVSDGTGCGSDPADVTVHAIRTGRFTLQLTWAESHGDVDLHLLGPNGRFNDDGAVFGNSTDCFYATCKPRENYSVDWGRNGTTTADNNHANDPQLEIDALWGHGPEIISDATPFDATYTVVVHDYCSRPSDPSSSTGVGPQSYGPVTATLKVFVDGTLANTFTQTLTQRDKWTPATITVSGNGTHVDVTPSTAPVTKSTGLLDACTADTN